MFRKKETTIIIIIVRDISRINGITIQYGPFLVNISIPFYTFLLLKLVIIAQLFEEYIQGLEKTRDHGRD